MEILISDGKEEEEGVEEDGTAEDWRFLDHWIRVCWMDGKDFLREKKEGIGFSRQIEIEGVKEKKKPSVESENGESMK